MTKHVAIWIDHKEARIFHVAADSTDEVTITAPLQNIHHRHSKGAEGLKEHPDDAQRFFQAISRAVEGAQALLIVGPSNAKLEFLRYLQRHEHKLEANIVGIETVDHPTDGQLVAYAKNYFKRSDRMG